MIPLADIWIAVLCGVTVALATSLAAAFLAPLATAPLQRIAPSLRSLILSGLLCSPLIAGVITAGLVATSTHALPIDFVSHHCHADTAACVSHARAEETLMLTALGGGTLGAILVWLALSAFDLASRARTSRRLLRLASNGTNGSAQIVQTGKPVAVSAGIVGSETFVS